MQLEPTLARILRAHLHLHCPSIRVRDPDRIVFKLYSRLGSEVTAILDQIW